MLNLAPRQEAVGVVGGVAALDGVWVQLHAPATLPSVSGFHNSSSSAGKDKMCVPVGNQAPYCSYHTDEVTPIPEYLQLR
jgi:hypothetical protein